MKYIWRPSDKVFCLTVTYVIIRSRHIYKYIYVVCLCVRVCVRVSGVSLYHSDRHAHQFHLFFACNNSRAFHQHNDEIEAQTANTDVAGVPGFISKHQMLLILVVPVLVPEWKHAVAATIPRGQSVPSVWVSWAIPSCYLTSLDLAKTRQRVRLIRSILDPGRWQKLVSPRDMGKATDFLWCSQLHSTPLCPCVGLLVSRTRR